MSEETLTGRRRKGAEIHHMVNARPVERCDLRQALIATCLPLVCAGLRFSHSFSTPLPRLVLLVPGDEGQEAPVGGCPAVLSESVHPAPSNAHDEALGATNDNRRR